MSLKEYSEAKKTVKPLTVQELMYERQYNPSLAGQNGVFTVAENAIGLDKITTQIKGLIGALGTETDESTRFYSKQQISDYLKEVGARNPTSGEMESLQIMQDILSTPGDHAQVISKVTSQKNHLKKALDYI